MLERVRTFGGGIQCREIVRPIRDGPNTTALEKAAGGVTAKEDELEGLSCPDFSCNENPGRESFDWQIDWRPATKPRVEIWSEDQPHGHATCNPDEKHDDVL